MTVNEPNHPTTSLQTGASVKATDSAMVTVASPTPIQKSQSRDHSSSIQEFPAMREDCPKRSIHTTHFGQGSPHVVEPVFSG